MANNLSRSDTPPKPYFVSIGNFLALGYWNLEAYIDSILIEGATFSDRLFPPDPNELWMRILVCLLFVGFGLYAHAAQVRIKAAHQLNVDSAWLLKNALANTIRGRFPICDSCMSIRDENGEWVAPDEFISAQTEAEFLRIACGRCKTEDR